MSDERNALKAIFDDLLVRAEMNAWQNDGEVVVEVGAGVWYKVCTALDIKSDAKTLDDLPASSNKDLANRLLWCSNAPDAQGFTQRKASLTRFDIRQASHAVKQLAESECDSSDQSDASNYKLVTPPEDWVLKTIEERGRSSWCEKNTTPDGATLHLAEFADGVALVLFGVEVSDADKPFEIMVEARGVSIDLIKGKIDDIVARAVDDFFRLRANVRLRPWEDLSGPIKIQLNLTTS